MQRSAKMFTGDHGTIVARTKRDAIHRKSGELVDQTDKRMQVLFCRQLKAMGLLGADCIGAKVRLDALSLWAACAAFTHFQGFDRSAAW